MFWFFKVNKNSKENRKIRSETTEKYMFVDELRVPKILDHICDSIENKCNNLVNMTNVMIEENKESFFDKNKDFVNPDNFEIMPSRSSSRSSSETSSDNESSPETSRGRSISPKDSKYLHLYSNDIDWYVEDILKNVKSPESFNNMHDLDWIHCIILILWDYGDSENKKTMKFDDFRFRLGLHSVILGYDIPKCRELNSRFSSFSDHSNYVKQYFLKFETTKSSFQFDFISECHDDEDFLVCGKKENCFWRSC